MDIKELSNTMNEEKVRKEAAVALFNALGPKHIATAEAYCALGDLALEKDGEKFILEAYDYYKKAYEGFSTFYKNSLMLDNLEYIYTYFLLCDATQDTETCEQLMDLYFDDISQAIIEDEKMVLGGLLEANFKEIHKYIEANEDKMLQPDKKETYLRLFEAFLSYVIEHYEHDDTDFVTACETYDHFLPALNEFNLVDTYTSSTIVQYFVDSTNFGSALCHLEFIFAYMCFDEPEEGLAIGNMLFNLMDFIEEVSKDDLPPEMVRLVEIGKKYRKKFVDADDVDVPSIYPFVEENFRFFREFDD